MTRKKAPPAFPKGFIAGCGVMIVLGLAMAVTAKFTGVGESRTALPTNIVEQRLVVFSDRADGAVVVSDADNPNTSPDVLMPGAHGFVRVAVSGLAYSRHTHGVGKQAPFVLMRASDDRMWLYDPQTNAKVDLNAFGPQNRAVWAALLPSSRQAKMAQAGKVAP
jgi:putative photosynthetic complex assembly protein